MAAFEDIGLVSAEHVTGVVPLGNQFVEFGLRRAAVVAGDQDQRIVAQAVLIQRGEHLADGSVGLHHKIGIGIQAALALPRAGGQDRLSRP